MKRYRITPTTSPSAARPLLWLVACSLVAVHASIGSAQSAQVTAEAEPTLVAEKEASKFLRIRKNASGDPVSMQTSIARYRPDQGDVIVDLIGAVHIGEGDYYQRLNKQFDLYDVVLYELVAPQGTRVPKGGKKESTGSPLDLISWMQGQAKSTLGLESQLEKVDYQKAHFVHADLSPTEMGQKMAERGDNALTVGLTAFAEMLRKQNKMAQSATENGVAQMTGADLMDMLDNPLELKKMMAKQFETSGVMEEGLGDTLNQLLVVDRNAAAMKVLQKQIVSGKKKIAVFYGAAHMPDFEKRMADELGLRPDKHVWIDAWDLTKAGESPLEGGTTGLMLQMMRQLSK
ncbi:hypothetical protein N9L06_05615 [Mariniblastus sp.]|nr:hypothetical protein [Mariniblastus sp.]